MRLNFNFCDNRDWFEFSTGCKLYIIAAYLQYLIISLRHIPRGAISPVGPGSEEGNSIRRT